MKHLAGGIQRQVAVRHHAGVVPAPPFGVVDHQHMICKYMAKSQLAFIGGLCFEVVGQIHLYFHFYFLHIFLHPHESKIFSAWRYSLL